MTCCPQYCLNLAIKHASFPLKFRAHPHLKLVLKPAVRQPHFHQNSEHKNIFLIHWKNLKPKHSNSLQAEKVQSSYTLFFLLPKNDEENFLFIVVLCVSRVVSLPAHAGRPAKGINELEAYHTQSKAQASCRSILPTAMKGIVAG